MFALLLGSTTQLCVDSVCPVPTSFYVFAHHIIKALHNPDWLLGGTDLKYDSVYICLRKLYPRNKQKQLKQLVLCLLTPHFVCAHPLKALSNSTQISAWAAGI